MINRLFIAEKPNLGRAIAEGLGRGTAGKGFIAVGSDAVTWCFGHMLEQHEPEQYSKDYAWPWRKAVLPIVPDRFTSGPRIDPKTKKADSGIMEQIRIIGKLVKECKIVVNAGDPDREGQLIIDEMLEYFGYSGPAERIWLASLDPKSVAKALSSLKDNAGYRPLRDAAIARSRIDWLGGLNLTRAMSLFGWEQGMSGVLSMGRVQTPTLGLVVDRDRLIENFKPVDYFVLQAPITHLAGPFTATLVLSEGMPGTDSEGRLVDARVAQALVAAASHKTGVITSVDRKEGKLAPPKPYSLSSLQKDAGAKYGLSAQAVLTAAQALYEKKLTTYPRTDCEYLPGEQFGEAGEILKKLSAISDFAEMAGNADASIRSSAWNTSKVTAHHAIIPTGIVPGDLKPDEMGCYSLVARNYILQFWPPESYETQKIVLVLDGKTQWEARGRVVLDPGFRRFMRAEQADADLPMVNKGDPCDSGDVEPLRKKTSPPDRFTEGTLIEAMKSVHRFVTDEQVKSRLKETSGIGTEATRAGILETLKKRGYLAVQKKALISTDIGRAVVDLAPSAMRDVATTAALEDRLAEIAEGRASSEGVVSEYALTLAPMINALFRSESKMPVPAASGFTCPKCGKALRRVKGKKGYFWSCAGYPDCSHTAPDEKGKPGAVSEKLKAGREFACPECGGKLDYIRAKTGKTLFICRNDKKHSGKKALFFDDDNGAPVFRR